MLTISNRPLNEQAQQYLNLKQAAINALASYEERVNFAKKCWDNKIGTNDGKTAFQHVRATLGRMCVGPIRCAYCEDSLADEIEHINPKSLFPESTFEWINYAFSCGPCNGPKGNQYAIVKRGKLIVFSRTPKDPIVSPPIGDPALINPRIEDPMKYLELDLGGVTTEGETLQPTFEFLPALEISASEELKAIYTISTLGLNREILCVARGNAFSGFRARMFEYVEQRGSSDAKQMAALKNDLLRTPHLTVFHEMKRQRASLPTIHAFFNAAPEMLDWSLII